MACGSAGGCGGFETTLGDSKAVLSAVLTDNELPFDLDQALSVLLRVRKRKTRRSVFNAAGGIDLAIAGKVYYEFTGTEFTDSGLYEGQWVVTFPDGELTFPAGDEGFPISVADRF